MTRVLVTAIGGDIAQGTAAIIRECFPDIELVGCDVETRHAGSWYVDEFAVAPRSDEPDYLPWLNAFSTARNIDLCLPMSEAELYVLARAGVDRVGSARLLWAGQAMVLTGCDKLATSDFLTEIGVPGPWTCAVVDDVVPPSLPCIFKLRRGAGSKVVQVCCSIEDIRFFHRRYRNAVIQEMLPDDGQEITCAIYRDRIGETHVLQLRRRLTGGFTGWAEVIADRDVTAQCCRIAEAVNLHGAINAQLRLTASGPRIFEINPRLSSTVLMRHLVGFSDVKWLIEEALDRTPIFAIPEPGMRVARTHGAVVL